MEPRCHGQAHLRERLLPDRNADIAIKKPLFLRVVGVVKRAERIQRRMVQRAPLVERFCVARVVLERR